MPVRRVTRHARAGFALAAALVVVVAVALIVALIVESAGARAGMATADLASARATGDAESALAAALALVVDTAALRARPGEVVARVGAAGAASAVVEAFGSGTVRIAAVAPSDAVRGLIARTAFARLEPGRGGAAGLSVVPLPGGAWAPVP